MPAEHVRYTVLSRVEEVPGVVTLNVTTESHSPLSFVAGQYINVYFPELNTPEGKAYSISSAPHESAFSITVRAIGEFSHRLHALLPGDPLLGSLPYGFFYPECEESDVVMLAAGIGISPFRSMIRDTLARNPARRITLMHSIRVASDALFLNEFDELKKRLPHFSLVHFVTREEKPELPGATTRRMNAYDVIERTAAPATTEFLICGSIPFTRDMWRALRHAGISEDHMYTEAFFSH